MSGKIVETKHGQGIIYDDKPIVNGKLAVYLTNEDGTAKLDENGKPKRILCTTKQVTPVGFVDGLGSSHFTKKQCAI